MYEKNVKELLEIFGEDVRAISDRIYFGSMCPEKLRAIKQCVKEECDRMDYVGSMMYDECPDRLMLRLKSRKIYNEVLKRNDGVCPCDDDELLRDTITIMFLNEIYIRRFTR